mmetsp:Transcript_66145/g.119117  ORF Transcript_66145/g.119117 Transcript_66145/m.119117 type:complete len:220 (-) Transcript_66145:314-973(-)
MPKAMSGFRVKARPTTATICSRRSKTACQAALFTFSLTSVKWLVISRSAGKAASPIFASTLSATRFMAKSRSCSRISASLCAPMHAAWPPVPRAQAAEQRTRQSTCESLVVKYGMAGVRATRNSATAKPPATSLAKLALAASRTQPASSASARAKACVTGNAAGPSSPRPLAAPSRSFQSSLSRRRWSSGTRRQAAKEMSPMAESFFSILKGSLAIFLT